MKATLYTLGIICIIGGIIFVPLNPKCEWFDITIRKLETDWKGNMYQERYDVLIMFDDFGIVLLVIGIALISICFTHSKMIERNKKCNNTS